MSAEPAVLHKHPIIWFDNGNMVLRIDDCLFRVDRSIMALHFKYFRSLSTQGTVPHVLSVRGVSADIFAKFVAHIYSLSARSMFSTSTSEKGICDLFYAAHSLQGDGMLVHLGSTLLKHLSYLTQLSVRLFVDMESAERRLRDAEDRMDRHWNASAVIAIKLGHNTTVGSTLWLPSVLSCRILLSHFQSRTDAAQSTTLKHLEHNAVLVARVLHEAPRVKFSHESQWIGGPQRNSVLFSQQMMIMAAKPSARSYAAGIDISVIRKKWMPTWDRECQIMKDAWEERPTHATAYTIAQSIAQNIVRATW
ncbi:hypothetical protein BKA62DRAFT_456824 [Auriculariales sp. MPI-PUGE-AT-0066]|nr:hypothetical protein BKA62DRAFT_456824 [Auriculariales sp. MPI-PUGE-AT-0066]